MSNINENMGPVQDNYTQTYVSQYVPMPFEVMQRKAEMEQKEFDTIQDNWAVISSKMGEKVLDVDKPVMQEEVNKYQNTIDEALKAANGDWRKLSSNVKGVASKYRNFITTGEGAKAVSRLAEMNEKLEQIKDSELSGRMKKAQSNYLKDKYRREGGVRGENGGASIEEPILYDESKLADTLVDWVSKLKANKGDKIQAYKDADGKIKYRALSPTTYRDENLGKLVTTSETQKGVDINRIREVASGVYELPDFKDMIDAEMMVGYNKNMKVPLRDENGKIIKEDGKTQYEERDLTRPEYEQLKFAQKFGFIDAFAYMEEEKKYKLDADTKAADDAKKKKAQQEALEKQGLTIKSDTPIHLQGQFFKENEKADEDDLYTNLETKIESDNKNFLFDYTDKSIIYNTYKSNFGNQGEDSDQAAELRKQFTEKIVNVFSGNDYLKDFVIDNDKGTGLDISGAGINALFKQVAEGDEKILEEMKKAKIFYDNDAVKEFKNLAIEKDKQTYLNEVRLKEAREDAIVKGTWTTEKGIKEYEQEMEEVSDDYVLKTKGFLTTAFKKTFQHYDPATGIGERKADGTLYTDDELRERANAWQESVDYMVGAYTNAYAGKNTSNGKFKVNDAMRKGAADVIGVGAMLGTIKSMHMNVIGAKTEDGGIGSDELNEKINNYKTKFVYTNQTNISFLEKLDPTGGGDAEKGWAQLIDFSLESAKSQKKYWDLAGKKGDALKRFQQATPQFNKSLEEKRKKEVVVNLNTSNTLELVNAEGVKRQFKMKDIIKDLNVSDILSMPLRTAKGGNEKSKPMAEFKKQKDLKPADINKAMMKALSDGVFTNDVDPETGTTDIVFTLGSKTFRYPFNVNGPNPTGGISLGLEGFNYSKKDLTEREIRLDLNRARVNSLQRTPVGNYRDGVTIKTKEPGIFNKWNKNFDLNFADGGGYRVAIDPTSVDIAIPLDNGKIRKELILKGPEAVKFIKVYKDSESLKGDSAAAIARREKFYKAFPRFKNMSAREITRKLVRERVYEMYPQSKPGDYVKPEKTVEEGSFRYGRRYPGGRRGTSSFQPRVYSYPDGYKSDEVELTPLQKDSMIQEQSNMWKQYADSSAVSIAGLEPLESEPEPVIDYSKRNPYPFEAMTGRPLSEIGSQDSVVQQDNTQPVPEQSQDQFPYVNQPSYAESITEAWNPANITNNIRYVDQQGYVNPQEEPKVTPVDSLNTEQLGQVKNDIDSTIQDTLLFEKQNLPVDTVSKAGEESLANIRETNPELSAKLDSLGITGDVTPESLATDFGEYQYEIVDAKTRETRLSTDPDPVMKNLLLPGQGDPLPEFMIKKYVSDFTDKFEKGGKQYDSGVIRKQNLKDFAGAANATGLVRFMAGFDNETGYKNGDKITNDMEIKDVKNLDCSSFTHTALNALGYDLTGSQGFKPDANSKYQFNKNGLSPYSGGIYHNSIESKKQTFKNTSEIDLTKLKDGQIIAFDVGENFKKDSEEAKGWEGNWRQGGNSQGIDHIGVITIIDGVPYIGESSSNSKMKGPALMKLEDRLKQLQGRLNKSRMKMEFKRDANDNKMYYQIPKTNKAGDVIYKTDKQGKFILDPKTKEKVPMMVDTDQEILVETKTRKPSIFIGEYPKKK